MSFMRKLHLRRTGNKDDVLSISQITEYLFISSWPAAKHVPQLEELDISLIISMIREKQDPALKQPPFQNIQLGVTDFVLMPISIDKLTEGVETALPIIENGGKVLTYCKSGIHRSAAMATCILIGKGYSVDEATQMVKNGRAKAKPETPHIHKRIEKFAEAWDTSS